MFTEIWKTTFSDLINPLYIISVACLSMYFNWRKTLWVYVIRIVYFYYDLFTYAGVTYLSQMKKWPTSCYKRVILAFSASKFKFLSFMPAPIFNFIVLNGNARFRSWILAIFCEIITYLHKKVANFLNFLQKISVYVQKKNCTLKKSQGRCYCTFFSSFVIVVLDKIACICA